MTFRRSAPAALIAVVVIVVAGLTFLSTRLFSGLTASVEQGQFQLMQSIVDTALRNAAEEALARADIIASLPLARQAVAAKDREKLLAEYADMFAVQRDRRGVDQAQFHVPPAQSLLRLHAPAQFGDDLTPFRPLVVAVNREHAARKGLAIAAGGPAIFGVAPVLDLQGQQVGSFEFGLAFAPIINGLKAAYGLDFSVFIEEKPLRQFARALDPAVLSEQNRVGRFIRLYTTNGALMRDLAGDADISAAGEPVRYTRDARDVPYGVLLVPLRDGAGDSLGVIAVARDFSGSRAAAGQSLVWQICLAVFAVVLLSGAIIVVVRGFLLRPLDVLDRRFAAVAAGERTEAVEESDRFCVEIRRLAEHHDRIRARAGGRNVTVALLRVVRCSILAGVLGLLAALAMATGTVGAAEPPRPGLPTGKGLPVQVKVGAAFLSIESFSENTGSFKATVDLRLRWIDTRLRRPAAEASGPPRVLRGDEAQALLAELWVPKVDVVNQRGEPGYSTLGLRLYPDGHVEMTRRITGEFAASFDVGRFPFDRQELRLELAMRDQTADIVALEYDQSDLDFSRAAPSAKLDGWEIGPVALASAPLPGWYGATHAGVIAALQVTRVPGAIIAAIFIPLFASLLIPLLGIWLNRVEDGVFQIETFEFVNLIVGGLFAVIALNFTVNSTYQVLGSGDNPVSRLFALNYVALGISLMINVLLFRFNVVGRWFGRYVQEQLYLFLIWAVPLLMLVAAASVILVAMA